MPVLRIPPVPCTAAADEGDSAEIVLPVRLPCGTMQPRPTQAFNKSSYHTQLLPIMSSTPGAVCLTTPVYNIPRDGPWPHELVARTHFVTLATGEVTHIAGLPSTTNSPFTPPSSCSPARLMTLSCCRCRCSSCQVHAPAPGAAASWRVCAHRREGAVHALVTDGGLRTHVEFLREVAGQIVPHSPPPRDATELRGDVPVALGAIDALEDFLDVLTDHMPPATASPPQPSSPTDPRALWEELQLAVAGLLAYVRRMQAVARDNLLGKLSGRAKWDFYCIMWPQAMLQADAVVRHATALVRSGPGSGLACVRRADAADWARHCSSTRPEKFGANGSWDGGWHGKGVQPPACSWLGDFSSMYC